MKVFVTMHLPLNVFYKEFWWTDLHKTYKTLLINQNNASSFRSKATKTRLGTTAPIKDVFYFICQRYGHFKNECPNARAFTQTEWTWIHERSGPRAMFVQINRRRKNLITSNP